MTNTDAIDYRSLGSYDGLVGSFGYDVLLSEMTGSYQGDYHFLLRDGDKFAYLEIGYGSCSGCDHLESIVPWGHYVDPSEPDFPKPEEWQPVIDFANEIKAGLEFKPADELAAELQAALDEPNGTRWYVYDSEIRSLLIGKVIPSLVKPAAPSEVSDAA